VLTAYLTSPAWRPQAFQRTQNAWLTQLERTDVTPSSVFQSQVPGLLHSGDARWQYPKLGEVQSAHSQDVRKLLEPALATGPIEVVMVGDMTVDQAIASVAATFGALPARRDPKVAAKPGDLKFPAPTATPVVLTHQGRADQGLAFIAWPNTDVIGDMQEVADRRVLMDIFRLRLTDQLRAKDGATYTPSAGSQASLAFPGYGYLDAVAEIPPDKTQLFFDAVASISASLRDQGPTPDELERVREPEVASAKRDLLENQFWAANLMGAQFDDRHLALIRTSVSAVQQVTAADVQRAAQHYLVDSKAWRLVIVPKMPAAIAAVPPPETASTVLQAQ
jgi:zinc protease